MTLTLCSASFLVSEAQVRALSQVDSAFLQQEDFSALESSEDLEEPLDAPKTVDITDGPDCKIISGVIICWRNGSPIKQPGFTECNTMGDKTIENTIDSIIKYGQDKKLTPYTFVLSGISYELIDKNGKINENEKKKLALALKGLRAQFCVTMQDGTGVIILPNK